MKTLWFALIIALTTGFVSCKKDRNTTAEIYGTWKLTETWNDPGDGSGKYIKATGKTKYITFERSGELSGDAIDQPFRFKILDSERVEIFTTTYKMPVTYRYKLTRGTLELNPPCIEGCGLKFIRK
ncbi:hypothetical protein [Pedobacter frigoris]|uniref:Lipocalin-like domain-containing protein n=1 Tax=Pedobacter frigoris TaxID=2571272 RepID=A0A4U1CUF8_9SPHI|nr:hypothetical protein [Pedobacter frigoris]TKC09649.1 hypothetical protein FA047_06085 [Pedobacter frigoris]